MGVKGCQHRPRDMRIPLGDSKYHCRRCNKKCRCYHQPLDVRTPLTDGGYHCAICNTDVAPKVYSQHGTYNGHERHRRAQYRKTPDPEWGWPACEPCIQARRKRQTERRKDEGDRYKLRRKAWHRAIRRLRSSYPGDFAKYYAEELDLLGIRTGITRGKNREVMQADLTRVLSEVDERRLLVLARAVLGIADDTELGKLVRARVATKREVDRYRQIQQLRYILSQ